MSRTRLVWICTLALALATLPINSFAQGGGGGHVSTPGNNLSLPVIWSDGVSKALRGTYGAPVFNGETFTDELGNVWYLQQDALNEWQAESADWSGAAVYVDWIDWGDNLESKPWYDSSVVRVETVLYQDLATPMTGFEMSQLWGQGTSEMWGTSGNTYDSDQATVYSGCARFTIQKLTKDKADPTFAIAWNPATGAWYGDVGPALLNSAVWEGAEGSTSPSVYSAEINIPGKVIYGYNWNLRKTGDGPGVYRLTFSFDGMLGGIECPVTLNTFFNADTEIMASVEVTTLAWPKTPPLGPTAAEGEPAGGIPVIDVANNLTYIDVTILPRSGKGGNDGKGGKGGNDGNPGNGGNGGHKGPGGETTTTGTAVTNGNSGHATNPGNGGDAGNAGNDANKGNGGNGGNGNDNNKGGGH